MCSFRALGTNLSLQSGAVVVRLVQLGLQLGAVLLVLELQHH